MANNLLLVYLAKSILLSGIFYAYYLLVLRNKRFHTYNRFYLIVSLVLSCLIPFFSFTYFTEKETITTTTEKALYLLSKVNVKAQETPWLDQYGLELALGICGSVSFLLLGYLFFQIYRVIQLKNKHQEKRINGIAFIETEDETAPFSFLNNLFWKKSIDMNTENGQAIFKHEITHIEQKHTYDRLFCQIISAIFWMNPFTWIIQNELQNIHEFIADEEAVGNNNVDSLAKMILESQYGNHFLNPIHSFYYSSIKRRIIMLTTSKTAKYTYLRKVLALPLLATLAIVFSLKIQAQEQKKKTKEALQIEVAQAKKNELQSKKNEQKAKTLQVKSSVEESRLKFEQEKAIFEETKAKFEQEKAKFDALQAKLIPQKKSADIAIAFIDTSDIGMKNGQNGNEISVYSKNANGTMAPSTSVTLVKTGGIDKVKPLLVVDGVIMKDLELNKINPNNIESVNILKGENALAKYPQNGANGVVEIKTKKK
ncbi:MAG: M56 family metallopeptidase [Aquirufa sp.]